MNLLSRVAPNAVYLYRYTERQATKKWNDFWHQCQSFTGEHFVREVAAFENGFANPLSGKGTEGEHGAAPLSWATGNFLLACQVAFEPSPQLLEFGRRKLGNSRFNFLHCAHRVQDSGWAMFWKGAFAMYGSAKLRRSGMFVGRRVRIIFQPR